MAIVNRKSTAVTNATAIPKVLNSPALNGAPLKEICSVVASAADDSATSVFRFHRIASNARVSEVRITSAAASTAGAIDIGLYQTEANGGAVVDADFFTSALALTAAQNNADVTFESGVYTLANSEKVLWQALGLSADPQREYDIAATITTTFNGGPTAIRLLTRFVQ